MGKSVEKAASLKNLEIVSRISPNNPEAEFKEINDEALKEADVCIDFSHPKAVISNAKETMSRGKNLIIGTTDWYKDIDKIKKLSKKHNVGILYAANFSLGVYLFAQILEHSSKLFQHFDEYDIAGLEAHHKKKIDSPSGTAKMLQNIILRNIQRKKKAIHHTHNKKILPEELLFTSLRCGSDPGTHSIVFDSDIDTITLTHKARNREGFANGAILAAKWIHGRSGLYTIDDMMLEIIK